MLRRSSPREWLKKIALMDSVYLLNSPFTFQSMEKHAAYCAMIRLGLHVPDTVLVPYKNPVDNARYAYTAARYNKAFDLDAIAERIGYPLFMKPYDGGAWRGVSKIRHPAELHAAYDASGEMLMHLQKSVEDYSPGLSYDEKLGAYRALAEAYFESERYQDFCATGLGHIDEVVLDWVSSPQFDNLLIDTVRSVYPEHEHDQFIAHLRGLTGMWVSEESARLRAA